MEIVLVIIVVVVIAIIGQWFSTRRRKALAAWAAAHQLAFRAEKDYQVDEKHPGFDCLQRGDDRYAYNIMSGAWDGQNLLAVDYHYKTETTNSKGEQQSSHHHFSAVIVRSPVPLRPLFIRPEGVFDKITEFMGFDDIDFESAEFSRKFYVKAPDRKWAYDVIHQRTMEFLLSQPRFSIQFAPVGVIVSLSRTFKPDEFGAAAGVAAGMLNRLPDYVVRDLQAAVPAPPLPPPLPV